MFLGVGATQADTALNIADRNDVSIGVYHLMLLTDRQ